MTSVPAAAEPHITAIVELLDAGLQQRTVPIHAYNGRRPDNDVTCVVVHGFPNAPFGSLGDRYADAAVMFQVVGVGTGPEQATAYADDAQALLLTDTPPTVPGRVAYPVAFIAAQPVARDDTVQPPLWIATAQYAIKSNPA